MWDGHGGVLGGFPEQSSNWDWAIAFVMIACFVLFLVANVGTFMFKRWGRTLLVVTTFFLIVASPALGITIILPYQGVFMDVSTMLFGGLLAMAYLPPISEKFDGET